MTKWIAKEKNIIETARKNKKNEGKTEYKNQPIFAENFIPGDSAHDTYKRFIGTKDKKNNKRGVDQHIAEKICNALDLKLEEVADPIHSPNNLEQSKKLFTDDFAAKCRSYFGEQCQNLSSNPLTRANHTLDDVFVPLGLVEPKEQTEQTNLSNPRAGSQLYHSRDIARKFNDNQDFYQTVLHKGDTPKSNGKKIVIIGEPGAGKTTQLQKIGDWLANNSSRETIIIWVSLAELDGQKLDEYLLSVWLEQVLSLGVVSTDIQNAFVELFKQSDVWLLLDGVDEMADPNPLQAISRNLRGWITQAKIVLTCRLNQWQANRNELNDFDVFKNLDFTEEQQKLFIEKYFSQKEKAKSLISELKLDAKPKERRFTNKDRIIDCAKNPIRLTLLCEAWKIAEESLPDTEAELYKWFTDAVYDWKQWDCPGFTNKHEARKALDRALGELSKEAIDSETSSFRLTHSLVKKHLGEYDAPLYKLAMDIGWLNKIGVAKENPNEAVYSFFHATFQEYFAALAIDDWDYFLPRDHDNENPKPVPGKKYRVFDDKWRQVIIFWLDNKHQNIVGDFLDKVYKFQDGIDHINFCRYRALRFLDGLENISTPAKTYLGKVFWNNHEEGYNLSIGVKIDDEERFNIRIGIKIDDEIWGKIPYDRGEFLYDTSENNIWIKDIQLQLLDKLKLTPENVIVMPLTIARHDDPYCGSSRVLHYMASPEYQLKYYPELSLDTSILVDEINQRLKLNNLDNKYFDNLIGVLNKYYKDDVVSLGIFYCLESIEVDSLTFIKNLKFYLKNYLIERNKYQDCDSWGIEAKLLKLVIKHAENLDYNQLYSVWNNNSDIEINTLERQFIKLDIKLDRLKATTTIHPIKINLQSLEKTINISEISQEFCNEISQNTLTHQIDIPEAENAAQVKRFLLQVKQHLETPKIALVIYNCDPYPELISFCRKLANTAPIFWITEQKLEPPLQGIPMQNDLIEKLQARIEAST